VPADDPLLLEYLEYDCRSLFEILEKLHEASGLNISTFVKCPTPANMSMRIFENQFPDQAEQTHTKNFLMGDQGRAAENFLRDSYNGGRTELIKNKLENGFSYDFTSLYPYVMREFTYPIGKYFIKDGSWAENIWDRFCGGEEIGGVIEATVEIPKNINPQGIPPLPFYCEKRGKLLFPVGRIRSSWTIHELKFAVDRGVKIKKFHRVIFFEKMSSVFIGFVNYFEDLKNENTEHIKGTGLNKKGKKINPSLRTFAKIVLNSLYGKFGSRRENKSYVTEKELPQIIKKWTKNKKAAEKQKRDFRYSDQLEFFNLVMEQGVDQAQKNFDPLKSMPLPLPQIGGENLWEYESYSEARFIQVQICSYITAYARMHLYKAFEKIWELGGLVYYFDTDSIYTDVELPPDMIDSATFGKLKEEGKNISGLFVQEKGYFVEHADGSTESKFKGIKKDVLKEFDREYYETIFQHQRDQDLEYLELIREEDEEENLNKFMTAVKRGTSFNKMNLVIKGIYFRGEEGKRKIDYDNNSSEPWEYDLDSEPEIDEIIKGYEEEDDRAWICWEDKLEEQLRQKFKIPNRNTKAYTIYSRLDPIIKRKYFSSKAENDLADLCDLALWNIEDILIELPTIVADLG
jgi:DNA polymerase elongation subunit (family B)